MALPQLPQNEIARDAQFVQLEVQNDAAVVPIGIDARRARAAGGQPVPKPPPPPPPPMDQAVVLADGAARRATQAELLERLRRGEPPQMAAQAPLIQRVREQEPLIVEVAQTVRFEEVDEVHPIPMEGAGRSWSARPQALRPAEPDPEVAEGFDVL